MGWLIRALVAGLSFLGATHAAFAQDNPPLTLGIMEETARATQAGPTLEAAVRAVFFHRDGRWQAFDQTCRRPACFVGDTTWTIGFDGRASGTLSTRPPAISWAYSTVGRQPIVAGTPPWVGQRTLDFAGWVGAPVHRPLIATTGPSVADPDRWRPAPARAAQLRAVQAAFQARYPSVLVCRPSDFLSPPGVAWTYPSDAPVVFDAHASARGWRMISLALPLERRGRCEGIIVNPDETENPWVTNWFRIAPDGALSWMGIGMRLVDAADIDQDGRSEVVFATSGYNRDGYRLFADDFATAVSFAWQHH